MSLNIYRSTGWRCAAVVVCLLLTAPGCGDASRSEPQVPLKTAGGDDTPPPPLPVSETWDVLTMFGQRAGYQRTRVANAIEGDRKVVRTESLMHLDMQRFGQATQSPEIRVLSVESPEGQLIRFESVSTLGPQSMKTVGEVVGNRLKLVPTGPGPAEPEWRDWSPEIGGPFAVEQSLERKPMQPGEERSLRAIVPALNEVATIRLVAQKYEPARLLGGDVELLRVELTMDLGKDRKLEETRWTNRAGETLRTRSPTMNVEAYRSTEAVALAKDDAPKPDLSNSMLVPVGRRIEKPQQTLRIRYRVELKGGDPAAVFVGGPSQLVESIDANSARITVYAIRPGRQDGNAAAPADPPAAGDREPNQWIQSAEPPIVADARQVAAEEKDPWKLSLALAAYVLREVRFSYSQAFASAADVAKLREGDCTERAVFLAALARARGIPARTAVGLIYVEAKQPAMCYHMWNEVYVDGRWIPLDANAGGATGAAYLKIAQSDLKGVSSATCFLPVAQVFSQLKIEIEDVE
jgi:transglutaminase-like putative cysteine protease